MSAIRGSKFAGPSGYASCQPVSAFQGAALHPISRAHYELVFKVRFMEAHGQAFQDFFSEIMEKRYPADFHRVKPWGRMGDLKNDGYLQSARLIFQVYAPSEFDAATTIAKIEGDFEGAIDQWRPHCDGWVFVTSEREGLPAPVDRKLLELGERHAGVSVRSWGFEELRGLVFALADDDVAALLGPPLVLLDVLDVRRSDLAPILEGIASRLARSSGDLRPVPQDKLDANGLSDYVRVLLAAGMEGSKSVADFFGHHFDPTTGDSVATSFAVEYGRLRDASESPDDIFYGLRLFAAGRHVQSPRVEAAVYALLAYLFERCDIYEAARASVPDR
jgi:hypothetical protein